MTEIKKEVKNKIKRYTEINEPDFITFLNFDINCLMELYSEGTITHFSDDVLRIANHFDCMDMKSQFFRHLIYTELFVRKNQL